LTDAPFICTVVDTSKLVLHKERLERVAVGSLASFSLESHGTSISEQFISISGPTRKQLKFELTGNPQAGYKICFEPEDVGDHLIDLKVGGESINECPFLIKVYDAKKVKVSEPSKGTVGKPVSFSSKQMFLFVN